MGWHRRGLDPFRMVRSVVTGASSWWEGSREVCFLKEGKVPGIAECFVAAVFGATPSCKPGLFMVRCSGITPGVTWGTICCVKYELGSSACKASPCLTSMVL